METEVSSASCSNMEKPSSSESIGKNVAEWEGNPCKHLEKGIDVAKLVQQIGKVSLLQCQGGCVKEKKKVISKIIGKKSSKENVEWPRTWVCLSCCTVGCGSVASSSEGIGTGHAWQHWLCGAHPIAMQCGEDLSCWCFSCKRYLEFKFVEPSDLKEGNQGLVMVGPSASPMLLEALRAVQERLSKENAKFREIQLKGATVEEKPVGISETLEEEGGGRRVVKGLVNLGNTCFFNSVLQNLLAIRMLQDHFSNPACLKEGHLTSCLRELYGQMISDGQIGKDAGEANLSSVNKFGGKGKTVRENRNEPVAPRALFDAVCKDVPSFRGYQQQDSQELLLCLLDRLHMEELNTRRLQSSNSSEISRNGDENAKKHSNCKEPKGINSKELTSFIYNVFGSELSSTVCCTECGHSSVSFETFLDLSLPLPLKQKPQKIAYSSMQASSGSTTTQKYKDEQTSKEKQEKEVKSLGSLFHTSEFKTELSLKIEKMSSSFSDNSKSSGVDTNTITPNISNLPEDLGWMDYLDTPAQSLKVINKDTLYASEIRDVPDQDGPSSDVSEVAPIGQQYDTSELNQNATLFQAETSKRNLFTNNGDAGANYGQDMVLVSDSEDHVQRQQQEEPLRMIGDSEFLLLPYEDLNIAEEKGGTVECSQKLSLVSTDDTLVPHTGDEEALPGTHPETMNGDFDGFAEMFNEEDTSFFKKSETEACESFLFNEENNLDDLWETDLADAYEECNETSKENSQDIFPMSIDGCLTYFTKAELLVGENGWDCENCFNIFNNSYKGCMRVSKQENRNIEYEHMINTTTNEAATYEEQLHLHSQVGGTSVTDVAVSTNFSKLTAKDLSAFKSNGMLSSEVDFHNNHDLKSSRKRGNCNMNSTYSSDLAKMDGHMSQHAACFNDSDNSDSCESSSEGFPGRGSCDDAMRIVNEEKTIDKKAETRLDNAKEGQNIQPDTCSSNGKSKQTCAVLSRYNCFSKYCMCDFDKLKSGALSSSRRDRRRDGIHSKENESQLKSLKRNATKVLRISKMPLVLTIHLKRFGQDMLGRLSKLSGHVAFQSKLDLRSFLDSRCPDQDSCIYHLVGVVEHSGSMRFGHYVAYVRGPKDENSKETKNDNDPHQNIWYCISDASVRKVSFPEVLRSEAYLLFYEKDVP